MRDGNGYGGAHLLLAFIAGAAAGAAAALLTAPRPGSETRDAVRGWARDAQGRAEVVPGAVKAAYGRAITAAREAFVEALEREPATGEEESGSSGPKPV